MELTTQMANNTTSEQAVGKSSIFTFKLFYLIVANCSEQLRIAGCSSTSWLRFSWSISRWEQIANTSELYPFVGGESREDVVGWEEVRNVLDSVAHFGF